MVYTFSVNKNCTLLQIVQSQEQKLEKPHHKNSRKGEQKLWKEIQKTWYIAQCWARKEGYKRAPFWLGQHYPAWPHLAQCNQCVPAYLVWAVFRDLASFEEDYYYWRTTKLVSQYPVSPYKGLHSSKSQPEG
jgi:rubredoxin